MPSILIVEKNGNIKSAIVKNYSDAELYRKAGLKNADNFIQQSAWSAEIENKKYTINLYGKTEGKSNQENKYEFPPPVDNVLFFGNCILVNVSNNIVVDLSIKEWTQIYEFLYGGFESMNSSDDDDDDDDEIPDLPKTKEGYVKDGFIVEDEEEDSEYSEEEYVKPKPKSKIKPVTKVSEKSKKKQEKQESETPIYVNSASELKIEEYL